MSLDRSLKTSSLATRHRSVLKRSERIAIMQATGRWNENSSPVGLPKIANRKVGVGKKTKKEAAPAAAAGAKPAAGAKAPAAGAKAPAAGAKAAAKPAAVAAKK